MRVVSKFGGSILRSGLDYRRAANIIRESVSNGNQEVVVVSAMKGVTDTLLSAVGSPKWRDAVRFVEEKYVKALDEAVTSLEIKEKHFRRLVTLCDELKKALWASDVLGETTPRVVDYVVSFGERLSAIVMRAALEDLALKAVDLAGWEAGIVTDDSFGEAAPFMEESERRVNERLPELLEEGVVPVVTGFIAATVDGRITTLGRGGSDYTATLLAAFLRADEARLYTDVPGIMTCDPRIAPNAKTIPTLSVEEALELAYLGAKKMHPRTFEPLLDRDVKVRVLSVDDPHGPSTLIQRGEAPPPIKAVAVTKGLAALVVKGAGMVGRPGTAAAVMAAVRRAGVNISAIMQPVSEVAITVVVKEEDLGRAVHAVEKEFWGTGIVRTIEEYKDLAAVSVVGTGLRDPALVSEALAKAKGFKVRALVHGPSELSLTLITSTEEAIKLARKLHDEVVLGGG